MADDHRHGDIIIVKKRGGGGHAHHGGAWKIAFADFMTAMMAFFLVLWIINATDKQTKSVISRYFNPVRLENPSKARKGLHGATSAPTEGEEEKGENVIAASQPQKKSGGGAPAAGAEKADPKKEAPKEQLGRAEAKMQAAEAELFTAPYEALDRIAGGPGEAAPGASPNKGDADPQRLNGGRSIDSFRDPFKPVGPSSPDDPVAFDADARNKMPQDMEPQKAGEDDKPHARPQPNATPAPNAHDKPLSGDATKPAEAPSGGPSDATKPADAAKAAAEAGKLDKEIAEKLEAAPSAGKGPDIEVRQTKDGLLISLTDKLDFSMFAVGSAVPRPELVRAMDVIGKALKGKPGHIVVRGHTDARPYRNGAYDNWRLSSDRAQMAYYMLTRGGAPAARFTRIEGYADRALRDPAHPLAAVNRRLEILIEEPKP
jgi:chemotaxis protein MotB